MTDYQKWTKEQLVGILTDLVPPSELAGRSKGALIELARAHVVDEPPDKAEVDAAPKGQVDEMMTAGEAARSVRTQMPVTESVTVDDTMRDWHDATPAALPKAALPELSHWEMMEHMAVRLARSALMPDHVRNKPDNALVLLLVAHDYGLTASMVLSEIAVIEGKPAKSAYLLRFLIRRDGHKLWCKIDYDGHGRPQAATWFGIRKDDPTTTHEGRYALADAVRAKLCTIDDHGDVRARDSQSRPKPWEKFTEDMLVARATSRLARRAFEDVVGGAAYIPEELGYVEGSGEEVPSPSPVAVVGSSQVGEPLDVVSVEAFRARLGALTPELRTDVRGVWIARGFPPLDRLTVAHAGPIDAIIAAREKQMPDDAEIIEETAAEAESETKVVARKEPTDATDKALEQVNVLQANLARIDTRAKEVEFEPCDECGQIGSHADDCACRPF